MGYATKRSFPNRKQKRPRAKRRRAKSCGPKAYYSPFRKTCVGFTRAGKKIGGYTD